MVHSDNCCFHKTLNKLNYFICQIKNEKLLSHTRDHDNLISNLIHQAKKNYIKHSTNTVLVSLSQQTKNQQEKQFKYKSIKTPILFISWLRFFSLYFCVLYKQKLFFMSSHTRKYCVFSYFQSNMLLEILFFYIFWNYIRFK